MDRRALSGPEAFTLLAAFIFHAYWSAPPDQQFLQKLMFLKNLAIAGGLFFVASWGAGGLSVDARIGRSAA